MNWKSISTAAIALLLGVLVAPFIRQKVVLASTVPATGHFELKEGTVDESNGDGQDVPTHEVFLLDTESGKVWKFQGMAWGRDKDGKTKVFTEPMFVPVDLLQAK